jgi:hypothetical protein
MWRMMTMSCREVGDPGALTAARPRLDTHATFSDGSGEGDAHISRNSHLCNILRVFSIRVIHCNWWLFVPGIQTIGKERLMTYI